MIEWERQQKRGQAEWVAGARRRTHVSTRAAAKATIAHHFSEEGNREIMIASLGYLDTTADIAAAARTALQGS